MSLATTAGSTIKGWFREAWGGDLTLTPDLDQIDDLTYEGDALWARLDASTFLTDAAAAD